jgi:hypothetical protein
MGPSREWLCHSDARQVSDLPIPGPFSLSGLGPRRVEDPIKRRVRSRQVADLPRIRLAEPLQRSEVRRELARSQVCRCRLSGFQFQANAEAPR